MLQRFYWLIENGIAGCSRPGGPEALTAGGEDTLDRDLAWLRASGIGAVLSLTETPLTPSTLERHGLPTLHLPVPDLRAPQPHQFEWALHFIDEQRAFGRAVVVHCLVGQGRTATILAAYLIRSGTEPDAAIAELRAVCPGAIGTHEQEAALHAFAARRDWIL